MSKPLTLLPVMSSQGGGRMAEPVVGNLQRLPAQRCRLVRMGRFARLMQWSGSTFSVGRNTVNQVSATSPDRWSV